MYEFLRRRLPILVVYIIIAAIVGGVSIAFASLTFSGTGISGDSGVVVDGSGTITIGTSSSTAITIGRSGITATFPGTVTITGSTTTLQNLVVSGNCVGCGIGNFTAGGDLSGSSTSQTVIGIQGRAVSSTAPSTNQVLTWNGSFWTPANVSSTGGGGALLAANNLSDLTNTSSARTNIGLGNLSNALQLVVANNLSDLTSTSTARIALGLDNLANALQLIASNNLGDLTSTSSARTNLGFTGGAGMTISGTGAIGVATPSISPLVNNAGYVTSTF